MSQSPDLYDRPETLDLLSCPLDQRVLIEASAGTGKTWTLSMLVMRLLLEAGLALDQILIVTFTEAATAELRNRIHQRIREGLDILAGGPVKEPKLKALLDRAGEAARPRLEAALGRMDRARISTIHGFCQHVLQGWPLLCGGGFDPELLEDQRALVTQLVEDFWRHRLYPADETQQRMLLQLQKLRPDQLEAMLSGLLGLPDQGFKLLPEPPEAGDSAEIAALWPELNALFAELAPLWQDQAGEIERLLLQAIETGGLKGNVYRTAWLPNMLKAAASVFAAPYLALPLPEPLYKLTAEKLEASVAKGKAPPAHAFFTSLDTFWAKARQLQDEAAAAKLRLSHALVASVRDRLREHKAAANQLSFDDLLLKVHAALAADKGQALAQVLRATYPAALIDEFQDTDKVQSAIFSAIYPETEPAPLFLIGDPKQSIYRFRGADIFAYLQMAQRPGLLRASLNTNYRSVASLLGACQSLFGAEGVFRVGQASLPEIRYQRIAAGSAEPASPNGPETSDAAMVLWNEPEPGFTVGQANGRVARAVAAEALALIAQGESPGAMAVLTRTHRQSRLMSQVLTEYGIPCLIHAGEPVFTSLEAWELELLLDAVIWPGDATRLKRALSTTLLGLSALELARLAADDEALDARFEQFRAYHLLLRDVPLAQGLPRLLLRLEKQEKIARRLAALPEGERRLANLRQLQELLLEASRRPGMSAAALLAWLRRQRRQPESTERCLQQLESEKPAVKILTVHRSKGLEFAIVFCPWLWAESEDRGMLSCYDAEQDTKLCWIGDLSGSERSEHAFFQRQQLELQAESIRLAYVALTRAKTKCYLAWIWQKEASRAKENRCAWSALGFLLGLSGELYDSARVEQHLQTRFAPALSIRPMPAPRGRIRILPEPEPAAEEPPAPAFRPRRPWQLSSFSKLKARLPEAGPVGDSRALARASIAAELALELPPELRLGMSAGLAGDERQRPQALDPFFWSDEPVWDETGESAALTEQELIDDRGLEADDLFAEALEDEPLEPDDAAEAGRVPEDSPLALPGGSRIGSFLHKVLELSDFATDRVGLEALIEKLLPACPALRGFEPAVSELLWNALQAPLDEAYPGLSLAQLEIAMREMPFYFPLKNQQDGALGELLASHGYLETGRTPSLPPGLMTGRLDLVFGWQGRYCVLDYKSTHLGSQPADYDTHQLETALRTSGQMVQGLLYSVALHRSLRLRLPDYDPARQLGEVYFMFLRGLRPGTSRGVYRLRPAPELIEALSRQLGGAHES